MDNVEMADDSGGKLGELEDGVGVKVHVHDGDERETMRSEAKPNIYYYTTMATLALLVLLWQHGFFACVRRAPQALQVAGIPQYAIDYAPIVWLHKEECYNPSDISSQVSNTRPSINLTAIEDPPSPLTLENLDSLNQYGNRGRNVYLTSIVDVTTAPKWLGGVAPDSTGKTNGAVSCAVIINDHGKGWVDVFYMYFYAYNLGNTVFGQELGDHIGDWEHNMIRFQDGEPQAIWYSQHGNGQAFTYKATEKDSGRNLRPITYSAIGSHATYAIAGTHDHTIPDVNLPAGLIQDYTNQGKKWDPTLNAYFYTYNGSTSTFGSINGSPVGAMTYRGRWGDEQYPDDDPRQPYPFFGFRKFVSGPTGPYDKQLNRTKVCPDNGIFCIVREGLVPLENRA